VSADVPSIGQGINGPRIFLAANQDFSLSTCILRSLCFSLRVYYDLYASLYVYTTISMLWVQGSEAWNNGCECVSVLIVWVKSYRVSVCKLSKKDCECTQVHAWVKREREWVCVHVGKLVRESMCVCVCTAITHFSPPNICRSRVRARLRGCYGWTCRYTKSCMSHRRRRRPRQQQQQRQQLQQNRKAFFSRICQKLRGDRSDRILKICRKVDLLMSPFFKFSASRLTFWIERRKRHQRWRRRRQWRRRRRL